MISTRIQRIYNLLSHPRCLFFSFSSLPSALRVFGTAGSDLSSRPCLTLYKYSHRSPLIFILLFLHTRYISPPPLPKHTHTHLRNTQNGKKEMAAATSTGGNMQGMRWQVQPDTAFTAPTAPVPAPVPATATVTPSTVEQLLSSIPSMYNLSSLQFRIYIYANRPVPQTITPASNTPLLRPPSPAIMTKRTALTMTT